MISLPFIYANIAISRCRPRVIVDPSSLSRRRDDCCITRVPLPRVIISYITPRVTPRVTFPFLIIMTLVILKNLSITIIFF